MKVIGLRNLTTDIIRFVTRFVGALSQLEEQRSNQHIQDQFQKFRDLLVNIKDTDTRTSALQTFLFSALFPDFINASPNFS